jgi:hypothetical protein
MFVAKDKRFGIMKRIKMSRKVVANTFISPDRRLKTFFVKWRYKTTDFITRPHLSKTVLCILMLISFL